MSLVETTWLITYPRPKEITHYQGYQFFGHEFKNSLLQKEHGFKSNILSSGIPNTDVILEVSVNIAWKYNIQNNLCRRV